jgi:hypothetical protein
MAALLPTLRRLSISPRFSEPCVDTPEKKERSCDERPDLLHLRETMSNMHPDIQRLIANVRIYGSMHAHDVEPGTHKTLGIKNRYDLLCQKALNLRLATAVVFVDWDCPKELAGLAEKTAPRPSWYPANAVTKPKRDLLQLSARAFGRSWLQLRILAEPPKKRGTFWDNDPALIFELSAGAALIRTASVGHEGYVYFLAYPKEQEWERLLLADGELKLIGTGEDAYRRLAYEPGKIFG